MIQKLSTITPTAHEKQEWGRMAQACYLANENDLGHVMSGAASMAEGARIGCRAFDALQDLYRSWLCRNQFNHKEK